MPMCRHYLPNQERRAPPLTRPAGSHEKSRQPRLHPWAMRVAHRCKNEFLPTIALPNRSASLPGAFLSPVIPVKDDPVTSTRVIPANADPATFTPVIPAKDDPATFTPVIPTKDDPATFTPVIPAKAGIQQPSPPSSPQRTTRQPSPPSSPRRRGSSNDRRASRYARASRSQSSRRSGGPKPNSWLRLVPPPPYSHHRWPGCARLLVRKRPVSTLWILRARV